jgi:hypothetical protein
MTAADDPRHARPLAAWLLRQLPPADAQALLDDSLHRAARTFPGGSPRVHLFQTARTVLAEWSRFTGRAADDDRWAKVRAEVQAALARLSNADRELIRAHLAGEPRVESAGSALARLRGALGTGKVLLLSAMPDRPGGVAGWLDRQVAGPSLGRLIAELTAVAGPVADRPTLEAVLGLEQAAVIAGGLTVLPADRVGLFLRNPSLLAELQDVVAEAECPYWDELFDHASLGRMVRMAREEPVALRPRRPRPPVYLRPWFAALATTVIVLGTVLLERSPRPHWGWNRPALAGRGDTDQGHLRALANAADEWHARPKSTPAELRRALREMRDGCTAMLAAGHPLLDPADELWLADACVHWGHALDGHLADLIFGKPFNEVRGEADATVDGIVKALRKRAGE